MPNALKVSTKCLRRDDPADGVARRFRHIDGVVKRLRRSRIRVAIRGVHRRLQPVPKFAGPGSRRTKDEPPANGAEPSKGAKHMVTGYDHLLRFPTQRCSRIPITASPHRSARTTSLFEAPAPYAISSIESSCPPLGEPINWSSFHPGRHRRDLSGCCNIAAPQKRAGKRKSSISSSMSSANFMEVNFTGRI